MVEPPPPPPPSEAAPPPPPPEPGRCPNCGAPHDVYQEYCLECGRRLPGAYVGGRYAEVWRRDSPIWLWAALAALLLVALVSGAVVALAATDDGKNSEPASSIPVVSTAPSTTDTVGVVTQQSVFEAVLVVVEVSELKLATPHPNLLGYLGASANDSNDF